MSGRFFLDTNIFIYTFDSREPAKQRQSLERVTEALDTRKGLISFQVVQEFLNAASRKFTRPLSPVDCRRYLHQVLAPLCDVHSSTALYDRAIELAERWRYGFYDALIISAALHGGCDRLYSEDLQHGQIIQGLTIVNPFRGAS